MLHPSNLIGQQIDQFRLDEFIAKGAMGMVFKAFDTVLVRTVALKLISKQVVDDLTDEEATMREEARKRLIQEAKAAGRLNHPNILTIFSYGETDDFEYICMEYLKGKTLNQVLSEKKVIETDQAMDILEQVLLALDAANKEQIVHRDIKPSNIMITEDGRVKVMDFGIAKLPSFSMTTTGTVLGTPYYMSPEQISGQKVDIRSDIFSVGAVLYQIVTGERPFEATNTATLAYKIVQVDPIPPDVLNIHVPHPLGIILRKALAKNPSERYQTPMEMMQDLKAIREKKRPPSQAGATLMARDLEAERTVFAKAGEMDMTVHAEPVAHSEGAEATVAGEVSAPKVRVIEFPRDPGAEGMKAQAEHPSKDQEGEVETAQEGGESGPGDVGGAESLLPGDGLVPLQGRPAHDFGRVSGGRRHRIVGILAVLIIVAGFWYVAFNAFRGLKEAVHAPAESPKPVQEAQTQLPTAPTSPQPEAVRPETTSPPPEAAFGPETPTPPPSVEQLIAEAKRIWPSDPAAAQKTLEKAVALQPEHFEASFQLARLLAYRMDYRAAIQQYEKTLQINKQNPEVYFNLGHIYLGQGNYDAAVENLEACWALKPPFQDEVLANLGIAYLKKNRPDRAQDLFTQALEINPANQVAKGYLATMIKPDQGDVAGGTGQAPSTPVETKESAEAVERVVARAKDLFEKDPAEARRLLNEAISMAPDDFDANFQLGRLLTFQKDYPGAIEQYRKALLKDAQAADVHFNLGYIYLVSKDYDKAIQYYESCLALSPPYRDEVLTNLGLSHLKKGNDARARELFEAALDANTNNEVARGYLRNLEKSKMSRPDTNPAGAPGDSGNLQEAAASGGAEISENATQPAQRSLEGDYLVEGVNPSGSKYKGKATLRRKGDTYTVTWTISNEKFSGSGTLNGDVLAVNWKTNTGVSGVVNYQLNEDGTLKGSWADGAGAETLIPVRQ